MSTDSTSSDRRRTSIHLRAQPLPSVPGYHVLERLGSGRNATIYRAIQLSMQREVALRVLNPRLSRIAGFVERYMQEARSAGGVHHANVVSCYDVGQADGLLYQAMELVIGRTFPSQCWRGLPPISMPKTGKTATETDGRRSCAVASPCSTSTGRSSHRRDSAMRPPPLLAQLAQLGADY